MKTTYRLLHILLLSSTYKRAEYIDFEQGNINNNININVGHTKNEGILDVRVKLNFDSVQNGNKIIESEITMVGSFEFENNGDKNIPVDAFAKINAPAIIFPFIREHLANLTMKSGVQPVFLPPVNFVALAKKMDTD